MMANLAIRFQDLKADLKTLNTVLWFDGRYDGLFN
jgi:hypothetical protein